MIKVASYLEGGQIFFASWEGGGTMGYLTFGELLQFVLLLVSLAALIVDIYDQKRK